MNILFAASEGVPFAKSGGLGDVIGSLPKALNAAGEDVRVILPLYKSIKEKYGGSLKFIGKTGVNLAWRNQYCGLFSMEYDGTTFYFIDNEQYFFRDGYYGHFDDGERFAYFSKAVLESLKIMDYKPEIIHCHDWQTALIPVFLKVFYAEGELWAGLKTVFTIHNIEYQGRYGYGLAGDVLGLPEYSLPLVDMSGDVNYMKGGIMSCDRLTTVSPTYAEELTCDFYGAGLASVIQGNSGKFCGILNGIDTAVYDPGADPELKQNYTAKSLSMKQENKAALQEELGLEVRNDVPVVAIVSRLASHKGLDLLERIFYDLMEKPIQFVLVGSGDKKYEDFFRREAARLPGRAATRIAFSAPLASRIYGGADFLLMPSISEPCGLAQMIAMRYGTIPVVRATGGLRDSVEPYNPEKGTGEGLTFATVNAHDLLFAIGRGEELFRDAKQWDQIRKNAMKKDCSWKRSAEAYGAMYRELK